MIYKKGNNWLNLFQDSPIDTKLQVNRDGSNKTYLDSVPYSVAEPYHWADIHKISGTEPSLESLETPVFTLLFLARMGAVKKVYYIFTYHRFVHKCGGEETWTNMHLDVSHYVWMRFHLIPKVMFLLHAHRKWLSSHRISGSLSVCE